MKHRNAVALATLTLALGFGGSCMSQEPPEAAKKVMGYFQGMEDWPERMPGSIDCKPGRFKPVRAVYDRQLNMNTDDPTQVRAVWQIDQVAWQGEPVTMLAWFSSGETTPMTSIGYVNPETGDLRYREWARGSSVTMTISDDDGFADQVIDRDGETKSKRFQKEHAVFDRFALGHMMAGMKLEEGLKFKMKGLYPGAQSVKDYPVYVGAQVDFEDAHGNARKAWPVMHPMGGTSLGTYFVDTEPPYLIGFEYRDIMTQEVSMRVSLDSFQLLD